MEKKEKQKCIYLLISPSYKCYVGKSVNLANRFKQHRLNDRNTEGPALHKALNKYGWDNFLKVILETFEDDVEDKYISKREVHWIKYHETFGSQGYNCTKGGEGMSGYKHTKETLRKISLALKGRPCSENAKKAVIKSNKEKVWTHEMRERISHQCKESSRKFMKAVVAINKKTGERRKFDSINSASRVLSCDTGKKFNRAHISNCANKRPSYNSHHGWTFEFVNKKTKLNLKIEKEEV